jgi:hypothetical protein
MMIFENEIVDYAITISEDGCCAIRFEHLSLPNRNANIFTPYLDIVVSDCLCVFNPLYDPEKIITKAVKAAVFIRSLKDHMAHADLQWLVDGVTSVVNGSKEVCVYKTFPNPIWSKTPKVINPTFKQQHLGKFV